MSFSSISTQNSLICRKTADEFWLNLAYTETMFDNYRIDMSRGHWHCIKSVSQKKIKYIQENKTLNSIKNRHDRQCFSPLGSLSYDF